MLSRKNNERLLIPLLLLPGVGYILVMIVTVLSMTVLQSFGFYNLTGESHFTFKYWMQLFDKQFVDSFLFSAYVGLGSSICSMIVCYPLALFLHAKFPGKNVVLPFIRIPLFVPALVATFLIINILDYHGLVNEILVWLGLIKEPLRMRNDQYALGVLFIQMWKNIPFQLVIVSSALEGIREDIKEAARNLGAGSFTLFTRIIFPLTISSALVAMIMVFIGTFGDYSVTKAAGPMYPSSMAVLMHTKAFMFQEWNYAACVGVVMIVAVIFFVACYTKIASIFTKSY